MNADAVKTTALYDPITNHIFIGSGPWTCGTGAGLGQACTPGMVQNPGVGQSYTLKRNGLGITPGFSGDYHRGSGFLATFLWSGDLAPGVNNFSAAKACFAVTPLSPLSASPPSMCGHWQQGIGTNGATTPAGIGGCPAGTTPCGIPVGAVQISIVKLYVNINWFYPDLAVPANCSGQVCLSFDPLIKFIDTPAATTANYALGTWTPGKTVVYDKDSNGVYDVGVDSVIAGPGAIGATNCSGGTQICLSLDPHLKFIDPGATTANAAGTWAFGKTVVYDTEPPTGDGLYDAQDLVIAGTGPPPPFGIIPLDPVLYAGSSGTLSPATGTGGVGCANPYNPTSTTSGGYDC
jgi:hypothetical protein